MDISPLILKGYNKMLSSRIGDSEPVLNLKGLFYGAKTNGIPKNQVKVIPLKSRYDNFKLLQDIQSVLQNCTHLSNRDRLNYCNTQRYFMKLYLREINKPE
ncbi:hypothetical protein LCGC14_1978660 [marine sediment metagenome]|uniref:Uncharacterized protein n=2 Tax=marine sediment metagenome TaxID=412755 RepID=A0A0F9F9W6_9ZZZZ|nr:MAG: hypothetical protein Lokiarch_14400 [Candidatus Lokiarchaeum sp. GC14_75]